jgi:hypothetical protein
MDEFIDSLFENREESMYDEYLQREIEECQEYHDDQAEEHRDSQADIMLISGTTIPKLPEDKTILYGLFRSIDDMTHSRYRSDYSPSLIECLVSHANRIYIPDDGFYTKSSDVMMALNVARVWLSVWISEHDQESIRKIIERMEQHIVKLNELYVEGCSIIEQKTAEYHEYEEKYNIIHSKYTSFEENYQENMEKIFSDISVSDLYQIFKEKYPRERSNSAICYDTRYGQVSNPNILSINYNPYHRKLTEEIGTKGYRLYEILMIAKQVYGTEEQDSAILDLKIAYEEYIEIYGRDIYREKVLFNAFKTDDTMWEDIPTIFEMTNSLLIEFYLFYSTKTNIYEREFESIKSQFKNIDENIYMIEVTNSSIKESIQRLETDIALFRENITLFGVPIKRFFYTPEVATIIENEIAERVEKEFAARIDREIAARIEGATAV